MKWNKKLNRTNNMFRNLTNITNIYFTKFDTSEVTDMRCMFYNCSGITSINLSNFNTSSVTHMGDMFSECQNLKFLDLSNFDTSLVTDMHHLIYQCFNLTSINLKNFNTSKVISMEGMFEATYKLKSLNLKKFNTSSVTSMLGMFHLCKELTSLDLSNFDISKVSKMKYMFKECPLLKFLNIKNFYLSSGSFPDDLFELTNNIKYYCLNNSEIPSQLNTLSNNCSYLEYLEQNKKYIIEKDEWVDNCYMDDTFKFEYNKTCIQFCPIKTYNSSGNICLDLNCSNYLNYDLTECIDIIPDGYYCNDSHYKTIDKCNIKCQSCDYDSVLNDLCISCNTSNNYYPKLNDSLNNGSSIQCYNDTLEGYILDDSIYKPCYHTCKNCLEIGNETNNNCIECISNYSFIDNETENNCYEICNFYYYFDSNEKYHCTLNEACPEGYKLIKNKRKCISNCYKDNLYKFEYEKECYETCPNNTNNSLTNESICEKIVNDLPDTQEYIYTITINTKTIEECQPIDFFNGICNSSDINSYSKDQMIEKIKNDIMNGTMDELLSNVLEGDKKDYIIEDDDLIYQITSTYNQNNSLNNNISTIILGECERILKKEYNISEDLALLIFKIDYFKQGSSIPIIGYEIYHPITKIKLNLTYCNKANININIPVSINEDNILKYDPNNKYYTDGCVPSTTSNGTDILLNDRQEEFNNNNMFLCEKNCTYNGYNNQKASCECGIKYQQIVISELVDENNIVTYNFTNKNDMITMKCYQTLFTKDGLIKNIGSYIMLFINALIITSGILFYKCGYYMLEENISEIVNKKENINKNINVNETIDIKQNKKKYKEKNDKKDKKENKDKKEKKINKTKSLKIKNSKKKKTISIKRNRDMNECNSFSNLDLNTKKTTKGIKTKKNLTILKLNSKENKESFYNDYDLNSFSYKEAKKYDKRNFISFYISLIRAKQPLIFSFCPLNDYNSRIIKIDLFFISLSLHYFINSLFFNESTIHKIYEDGGIYNFIYLIPYISYSFIISHILNIIIRYIFLSERNLNQIIIEKNLEKMYEIMNIVKRRLVLKYIFFFIIFTIVDWFIWYYLSSFGAVYQNTQVYIIENTMISFGFSLVFPFIFYLLPSFLRISSLKNSDGELLYKISKVIQFI